MADNGGDLSGNELKIVKELILIKQKHQQIDPKVTAEQNVSEVSRSTKTAITDIPAAIAVVEATSTTSVTVALSSAATAVSQSSCVLHDIVDNSSSVISLSDPYQVVHSKSTKSTPQDRKAILDALREKKSQLQELEVSQKNTIKSNLKSSVDTNRDSGSISQTSVRNLEQKGTCLDTNSSLHSQVVNFVNTVDNKIESITLLNKFETPQIKINEKLHPAIYNDKSNIGPLNELRAKLVPTSTLPMDKNSTNTNLSKAEALLLVNKPKKHKHNKEKRRKKHSKHGKTCEKYLIVPTKCISGNGIPVVVKNGDLAIKERGAEDSWAKFATDAGLESVLSSDDIEEGQITDEEHDTKNKSLPLDCIAMPPNSEKLRLLVAGDRRAENILLPDWPLFTSQEMCINNSLDMLNFCSCLTDKLIHNSDYDVVLIFSFHLSFLYTETAIIGGSNVELMKLRKNVDISHLLQIAKVHSNTWGQRYPHIKFVWVLPYPVDFYLYNKSQLGKVSKSWVKTCQDMESDKSSNDHYWNYIKDIVRCWKTMDIPSFPLHLLFFSSKQAMVEYSHGSCPLPDGLLVDGMQPSIEFKLKFRDLFEHYYHAQYSSSSKLTPYTYSTRNKFISSCVFSTDPFKPDSMFSQCGGAEGLPYHFSEHLVKHRELFELYLEQPIQHPLYHQHLDRYICLRENSGLQPTEDWRHYWPNFLLEDFKNTWAHMKNELSVQFENTCDELKNLSIIKITPPPPPQKQLLAKAASIAVPVVITSSNKNNNKSNHIISSVNKSHVTSAEYMCRVDLNSSISAEKRKDNSNNIVISSDSDNKDITDKIRKRRKSLSRSRSRTSGSSRSRSRRKRSRHRRHHHHHHHYSIDTKKHKSRRYYTSPSSSSSSSDSSSESKTTEEDDTSRPNSRQSAIDPMTSILDSNNSCFISVNSSPKQLKIGINDASTSSGGSNFNADSQLNSGVNNDFPGTLAAPSPPQYDGLMLDEDSNMDEKIDVLFDDPDFMEDLQNLGEEMQDILNDAKEEQNNENMDNKSESNEAAILSMTPSMLNGRSAGDSRATCISDSPITKDTFRSKSDYLTEVLRVLNNVANHFGALSASIANMHQKALECHENATDPVTVVLTKSNTSILEVVYSKMNKLIADATTPDCYKALYRFTSKELRQLLDCPACDDPDLLFSGVNIGSIARATVGNDTPRIIGFIKNTLMYHGLGQVSIDDVMKIFMAVKAVQLKLLEAGNVMTSRSRDCFK